MSQQTQAVATIAPNKLQPFRDALGKAQQAFAEALPSTVAKYLTPERLTKITLSSIGRNPLLLQCTPESVLRSVMDAAALGLEPTGGALGHAYLVPFRNKQGQYEAQLIVGYRGYISLARRSGDVQSVEAHVVYERDEFAIEFGLDPKLVHRPTLEDERGNEVAVYCVATFRDGGKHCEFMTIAEVERIRSRSRAADKGPWQTDYAEMCRKTVVRRAAKYWPLSAEMVRAIDIENGAENGDDAPPIDGEIVSAPPQAAESKTKRLTAKARQNLADAEARENHDPVVTIPPKVVPGTDPNDLPDWDEAGGSGREPGAEG